MKIAVKEVGKPLSIIETDEIYRTDCGKSVIGPKTTIQFIWLDTATPNTLSMAIDEDGLSKNLPQNFLIFTSSSSHPIQKIVGTAVFIKTKRASFFEPIEDLEVEDLTNEDIEHINTMLSEQTQNKLQSLFKDYGASATSYYIF